MFIVSRPQPSATNHSSAAAMTSAADLPGRVALDEDLEPALVDANRVAHRLELGLALHRPGEVELDVEGHELEALPPRARRWSRTAIT